MNEPDARAVSALQTMGCMWAYVYSTESVTPVGTAPLPATPQTTEAPPACTCNSGTAGPLGCATHPNPARSE